MRTAFYVIIGLILTSCYVLDNPYDSKAANYNASLTSTTTIPGSSSGTTIPVGTTVPVATTVPVTTVTTIPAGGLANGTYQIKNVGSGLSEQGDPQAGGWIDNATAYSAADSQKWIVTAVGEYNIITNVSTGLAIASGGAGSNAWLQNADSTQDAQLWTITSIGNDQFKLINKATQAAATIQNVSSGLPMQLGSFSAADDKFKWEFLPP